MQSFKKRHFTFLFLLYIDLPAFLVSSKMGETAPSQENISALAGKWVGTVTITCFPSVRPFSADIAQSNCITISTPTSVKIALHIYTFKLKIYNIHTTRYSLV